MATIRDPAESSLTRRHYVRENLQRMILNGEKRPGTKLRQQELAKRFQVAQGVIREALLELQAYGLVEMIDRRGMFVTKLNKDKILEAFEVREMHEALAVRLCCERVTRVQIRELVEISQHIYDLADSKKMDEMASRDRELHSRLVRLSGNAMLARLADNYAILGKFVRAERDPAVVHEEHLAILRAIEEGRCDDAERLVRQHVAAARLAVEKRLERADFKPHWVV
jgi:DNA-binding GntR family transcriptional regulator